MTEENSFIDRVIVEGTVSLQLPLLVEVPSKDNLFLKPELELTGSPTSLLNLSPLMNRLVKETYPTLEDTFALDHLSAHSIRSKSLPTENSPANIFRNSLMPISIDCNEFESKSSMKPISMKKIPSTDCIFHLEF